MTLEEMQEQLAELRGQQAAARSVLASAERAYNHLAAWDVQHRNMTRAQVDELAAKEGWREYLDLQEARASWEHIRQLVTEATEQVLRASLERVASLRRDRDICKQHLVDAGALLAQTPEARIVAAVQAKSDQITQDLAGAEGLARGMTLAAYELTKDASPAPGAVIKVWKTCEHPLDEAELEWCKRNMPVYLVPDPRRTADIRTVLLEKGRLDLLTVDQRGLESACKKQTDVPFTRKDDPRPQLAGDLSSYLREGDAAIEAELQKMKAEDKAAEFALSANSGIAED